MSKSRPRFFRASKKAFLVKLVSVLGFGGVVGFCVLSCDKQASVALDVADQEQKNVEVNPAHKADVKSDGQVGNDPNEEIRLAPTLAVGVEPEVITPAVEALEPIPLKPKVEPGLEISGKYGPPPPLEPRVATRYSTVMPKR